MKLFVNYGRKILIYILNLYDDEKNYPTEEVLKVNKIRADDIIHDRMSKRNTFFTIVVNSKTPVDGNMLWLELLK